ncbi:MAG: MBL fold metallo-hydrolase [Clostridia bacterium]
MMRVTILGCHSPYPGPGGATAGYLVETGAVRLLLDCGSGVISQLTKQLPIHQLDALLLSHTHHDHVADLGVLQYGIMVHQKAGDRLADNPLPIYAPEVVNIKLDYQAATRHIPIGANEQLTIGDVRISFCLTDHEETCYACKLVAGGKTLVYTADCGPATQWGGFLRGADLLICEATFLERNKPAKPMGHLSVRDAAQLAQENECQSLVLTHLYHGYTAEEVLAEATAFQNGPVMAASIGLSIQL